MRNITKISEITYKDVADYIRLEELDTDDINTLKTELAVARAFISGYTGLTDLDEYADLVIVVLILCQDMWDNRTLNIDKSNVSFVVTSILNLHTTNLL